jgi:putative membrane protein
MVRALIDVIRGALMGLAEVVPGVSGGTVALILGIYYTLIDSAAHAVRGIVAPLRGHGFHGLLAEWRAVRWSVVIPVVLGMGTAILAGAAVLEPLVEEYPVQVRALFFGLVLAGITVPAKLVHRWRTQDLLVVAPAALAAFLLVGVPPATVTDPSQLAILGSGALAVCALVLPGVSGSFLLLSLGMYDLTLAAVNDRDLAYLAVFTAGAVIGMSSFVVVLQWLLTHRTRITLLVLTGLMTGSLRALWPWQDEDRELLAPTTSDLAVVLLLVLLGMSIVGALLWLERRLARYLADDVDAGEETPSPEDGQPAESGRTSGSESSRSDRE